ncbi:MAG: hypothetical protein E4G92_01935 [Bacteroidia bacterium]|jgi:hypothetical protein|nr:MAG: hypothetical protein E4G92_01935 [Bacteroidia bacterium]
MINITEKKYEWGKSYRNSELAAGIISAVLAFVASMGGLEGSRMFVFVLFLLIAVVAFIHFFYLTNNRVYIRITSDGINVASRYLKSHGRFVVWGKISKVEKNDRKKLLTLSLIEGDGVKIYLSSLNKDDRDDLAKIINEAIGLKPDE